MSIRRKVILITVFGALAIIATLSLVSRSVLVTSYEKIEQEEMLDNLGRVDDALENILSNLDVKLSDWATWDDTYEFIVDLNSDYSTSNLQDEVLEILQLNSILYVDIDNSIVYSKTSDIEALSEDIASHVVLYDRLFDERTPGDEVRAGFITLSRGLALVAARPILKSDTTGPPRGTLMFLKLWSEEIASSLKDPHLSITFYPYDSNTLPEDVVEAKEILGAGPSEHVSVLSNDTIAGYKVLADLGDQPVLVVRIDMPRTTYNQGLTSIYLLIGLSATLILLIGVVLVFLLDRYLVSRVAKLQQAVTKVTDTHTFSTKIPEGTHDEIGKLTVSINQMLVDLAESNSNLTESNTSLKKEKEIAEQKTTELEKSKFAVLNLLEDIDAEKNKAEQTVLLRTQELREEKARLLASINSLSFGFVLADADDHILLKNPVLGHILDITDDIKSIHDITKLLQHPDSKVDLDIAASCKRCMELKEPVEFKEVPYGKKFLRIICAPVAAAKDIIGYIFLVEDITEAKVMERSREEFFAVASHELRTPLTAIRGNADMLLTMFADKIIDKDVKEMLGDIEASSVRLITVVNDFLEVSRLEQGRIEIKKENFDLYELIEKVIRDLKTTVEKKGITLSLLSPNSSVRTVLADKNRTEQVLLNLIGNATKFTQQGDIAVGVEQEGNFLKVRVTDTGAGISPHNQTLLFRKFQQAGEDMLARDVSQSTGLGLYISRLIMQTMGGEIGLEKSELGKGSTFFFTLPVGI